MGELVPGIVPVTVARIVWVETGVDVLWLTIGELVDERLILEEDGVMFVCTSDEDWKECVDGGASGGSVVSDDEDDETVLECDVVTAIVEVFELELVVVLVVSVEWPVSVKRDSVVWWPWPWPLVIPELYILLER